MPSLSRLISINKSMLAGIIKHIQIFISSSYYYYYDIVTIIIKLRSRDSIDADSKKLNTFTVSSIHVTRENVDITKWIYTFLLQETCISNLISEYKLENKLKILGFAGSLRAGSYNKALLRAAIDLLPEGVTLEIFDLLGIPAYNQDLESDMPAKVKEFKSKISEESDSILIATPEYNFSVPGVLKNAIDWASRSYGDNSFDGK